MVPFLQLVAENLTAKFGSELSRLTVVFPNNRARLFFNNYLVRSIDKPIWSPSYTTIQDLFASCTDLQVADDVKLVCDLYKAYSNNIDWRELGVEPETMDAFYFWGEVILSDFEDVDNNLVSAELLFRNISDLAKMDDDFSFLSEEQIESIRHFFRNFSVDDKTMLKRKFMALWNALLPMYVEFRENLRAQGLAYGGMLHRTVVDEVLKKEGVGRFKSDKYVFIGFNVLNKCEIELFSRLQKAGKALFYWDTDEYYMEMPNVKHEAATFMAQNLERFPNELSKSVLNTFRSEKKCFTCISSSTNNAQAKYLNDYLTVCKEKKYSDAETAVVLCDESLLLPVMHSIPPSVGDLNVTMGLPLIQTPVFALVKSLVEMQCSVVLNGGNPRTVPFRLIKETLCNSYVQIVFEDSVALYEEIVSKHIYFPAVSDLKKRNDSLKLLFSFIDPTNEDPSYSLLKWLCAVLKKVASYYRKCDGGEEGATNTEILEPTVYDALYKEALYRAYTLVNRLSVLTERGELKVSIQTMGKLLERMLSSTSVPFSGEPVKGMQVMGFLETRNLDFKNVVMLSVNEGVLPKGGGESSFIPHNLRRGFGMTTIEHKNSLYAYYFYRLLQRAENVTFLYCTDTSGGSKGQMSRFLMQLMAESGKEMQLFDLRSDIEIASPKSIVVQKSEDAIKKLRSMFDFSINSQARPLTPSVLNQYITCPMKFYFSYVLDLREQEEFNDEVDHRLLGLIFHASMQNIYERFGHDEIDIADIESLNDKALESVVDDAFRKEFFKVGEGLPISFTGKQLLTRMVVVNYVKNTLKIDSNNCVPFRIIGLETNEFDHPFEVDGMRFKIGGIIDRLQEESDKTWRVVDYKTGAAPTSNIKIDDLSSLFSHSGEKYKSYALQVFLYAYICTIEKNMSVTPSLLFTRNKESDFNLVSNKQTKKNYTSLSSEDCNEIEANLVELMRVIFSPEQPFTQTKDVDNCSCCSFVELCKGKKIESK